MSKPLEKIVKEYPPRGPLKQFRFEKSISFNCFRCGQTKVSKLLTIYNGDWAKRVCNGCYGRLLSIYEIKSGTKTVDEKSEELLSLLLQLANDDEIRQKSNKLLLRENKAKFLSPSSLRFLATSEFVAETISRETNLDWSPAIIGICKAVELEITEKFINGLKETCQAMQLSDNDTKDKDFGRIASYCLGKTPKSPELGAVKHFLQTAINSKDRLETSEFLKALKVFLSRRPNSSWLIDPKGLVPALDNLTLNFRNKAAHTDELNAVDYVNCKELAFGENGITWELLNSCKTIKSA
jgi:transcription elongation factor Elf1